MISIYKKVSYIMLVLAAILLVSGCGAKDTVENEKNVLQEDGENGTNEVVPSPESTQTPEPVLAQEPAEEREVKYQMDAEAMTELADSLLDGIGLVSELEEIFAYDRSEWFEAYGGEKLQRIPSETNEGRGPAIREDIIFYQTEEGEEPEEVVVKMIDAMIMPLMEPADGRPYTILEYEIEEEQPMVKIGDGIWMLRMIEGYYRYEGTDLVTMEQYVNAESNLQLENGMMPFQRQGSDGVFLYLLLQEGDVYRLQRYESMTTGSV